METTIKITLGNYQPLNYIGESVPILINNKYHLYTIVGLEYDADINGNWVYSINLGTEFQNNIKVTQYQLDDWIATYKRINFDGEQESELTTTDSDTDDWDDIPF